MIARWIAAQAQRHMVLIGVVIRWRWCRRIRGMGGVTV